MNQRNIIIGLLIIFSFQATQPFILKRIVIPAGFFFAGMLYEQEQVFKNPSLFKTQLKAKQLYAHDHKALREALLNSSLEHNEQLLKTIENTEYFKDLPLCVIAKHKALYGLHCTKKFLQKNYWIRLLFSMNEKPSFKEPEETKEESEI